MMSGSLIELDNRLKNKQYDEPGLQQTFICTRGMEDVGNDVNYNVEDCE